MQRLSGNEVLNKDINNYEALLKDADQLHSLREMGIAFIRSRFQSLATLGEAEDIVQEAFIDLFKALKVKDQIREEVRNFRSLFFIILLRKALYFTKRHSKRPIGHILNMGPLEFIEMIDEGQMGVSPDSSEPRMILQQVLGRFANEDQLLDFALNLGEGLGIEASAKEANLVSPDVQSSTIKRRGAKAKERIALLLRGF